MRFMMLVIPKGYDTAPADAMPDAETVGAMDKYNNELLKAGVVLAMDGLHPPSSGVRVTFPGGKPVVRDGPFAEAKEVLGGYWMIDVKSQAEAIKWAKKCPGGEDKVMHMNFEVAGSTIMGSDGFCGGTTKFEGFSLTYNCKDEAEAQKIFKALGEGGQVRMPLNKTFFSPAFGMLADKFGLGWMVIVPQAM